MIGRRLRALRAHPIVEAAPAAAVVAAAWAGVLVLVIEELCK